METKGAKPDAHAPPSSSATPGRTGSGNSVAPATQPRYRTKSTRMATTKAG